MRASKVMTAALMLALLLSVVMVMTASAAPPQPPLRPHQALPVLQAHFAGTVKFQASAKAPSLNNNSPAYSTNLINRRIPGKTSPSQATLALPTVPGTPLTTSNPGLSTAKGINAHDQRYTHGFNIEPPDQAICAGNGWVVEANNLVIKVYKPNLSAYSSDMVLEHFFGDLMAFGAEGGDSTVQGDPRCYWDPDTQHWFVTQLYLDTTNPSSRLEIMVSNTPDPNGVWNKYTLDTTNGTGSTAGHPGCPCLGDQPVLGASRDALFLTTNEFSISGPEFNGAQIYAFDKWGLANHLLTVSVVALNAGQVTNPDGACTGSTPTCWYSVDPASSPNGIYASINGGTEYLLSALDFVNANDNRLELWAFTNLSTLHGTAPNVFFSNTTIGSEVYGLPPSDGGPNPVTQKPGPTPLYDVVYANGAAHPGPIDSGDDRMQAPVYADGLIWGALNTGVQIPFQGNPEIHAGIAYFAVKPSWMPALTGTMKRQGYVAVRHENVMYPGVGVSPHGKGVLGFTLVGPDYWPSAGYVQISAAAGNSAVHIADLGQSPQDGFSEYQFFGTPNWRPRWGDYGYAAWDNGFLYFASEYIQYPNCDDATFTVDRSCGGTRGTQSNWGTSLSKIPSP